MSFKTLTNKLSILDGNLLTFSKSIFFEPNDICFRYDQDHDLWIAKDSFYADLMATIKVPEESLLLGTNLWTIHNDTSK